MVVTDKEVGGTTKKPGHDAEAKKNRVEGRADLEVSQRGRKQMTKRKRGRCDGISRTSRTPQPSTAHDYQQNTASHRLILLAAKQFVEFLGGG